MEVRLLFHGIALHSGDITERNLQLPAFIKAHLANPASPFRNQATMPARHTANLIPFQTPQLADDGLSIQRIRESLIGYVGFRAAFSLARLSTPASPVCLHWGHVIFH